MKPIKRFQLEKELEDPFYLKDPKLLELYNKCLPPEESYYYFPKGEEVIIINREKPIKSLRRIFYNQTYTTDEQNWLKEFKQLINSNPAIKLPDYFDDYFLLAFIYSSNGKLKDSQEKIIEYLDFIKRTFPMTITPNSKIIEILNKGFIYVFGRDNRYRPIIVCQCKVFQKFYKNYQTEELLQASSLLCQFIINHLLIPGQYETWNMIINMTGVSIISLPDPLKKLIPELSNYFLCRLYKNYIIGLNFISKILYKIAVNFIDKVTADKIIVLDKKKDPALFKAIRPDNVERQFGGTAPDMPVDAENGFFPPRMPSQQFITDNENPRDILITEDEYIKKYKNGEIPECCISPFIYEKIKATEKVDINKNEPQIQDNNKSESLNKEIKIKNSSILKKSNLLDKEIKTIQTEKSLRNKTINIQKKNIDYRVKHFIYNGWAYDEELSFSKYNYNTANLKHINILKDINNFAKKKQSFFSKISVFNGKN